MPENTNDGTMALETIFPGIRVILIGRNPVRFFQARLGQSLDSIFTDLFHFNFTSPLVSSGWSPSPL